MVLSNAEQIELTGVGEHAAKGIERATVELDKFTSRSTLAPHLRVGTYINLVGGVVAVAGPAVMKKRVTDSAGASAANALGWHLTTKLWDYVEEYLTGVYGPKEEPEKQRESQEQQKRPQGRIIRG